MQYKMEKKEACKEIRWHQIQAEKARGVINRVICIIDAFECTNKHLLVLKDRRDFIKLSMGQSYKLLEDIKKYEHEFEGCENLRTELIEVLNRSIEIHTDMLIEDKK